MLSMESIVSSVTMESLVSTVPIISNYFNDWALFDSIKSKKIKKIIIQNLYRKLFINEKKFSTKNISIYFELNPLSYIYGYYDNGFNKRINHTNNFIGSFIHAYNSNGNIILNPDDIWLIICFHFFLHKNKLTNTLKNNSELIVKKYSHNLTNFFTEINNQLNDNISQSIIDDISCNFSTTTQYYKFSSLAVIMNSCEIYSTYNNYTTMNLGSGISTVYFQGTQNDWEQIIIKVLSLKKYDIDGKLSIYLLKIQNILTEFLNTFNNKPNINFWNDIIKIDQKLFNKNQVKTSIDGWLLHFLGIYSCVDLYDIPTYSLSIPVKVINEVTNKIKQIDIVSNWISISKPDNYTYKPDIGICISEKKISS